MNKKIKLLAVSLLFLITACQVEENTVENNNTKQAKITEKTFEELIQESNFKKAFSKLSKRNTNVTHGRTVMEDQYGFTISKQPVKIIQEGNKTSYTMLITRDNLIHNSFENLVIETDLLNNTSAIIIKYNPNKRTVESTEHHSFTFEGTQEIHPIIYNATTTNSTSNKFITDCFTITTFYCDYHGTHIAGGNCSTTYPLTANICVTYDDGTGNSPDVGGTGDGDTGGTGNEDTGGSTSTQNPNPTPIPTSPVINYYYYLPNKTNGGNYLNLTSAQISWLNSQSIILRKMILPFNQDLNPEADPDLDADLDLNPSDVITFLMQNLQAPTVIGLNHYLSQNGLTIPTMTFLNWGINYLMTHPNVTFAQFQNWFMGTSEGPDGDYDAAYWDNPNLTFPPRSLPTYDDFYIGFPLHKGDLRYNTPLAMYTAVGGEPLTIFNSSGNENTCALRVSFGLNEAGIAIPNIPGKTFKGADNKYYFLAAANLLAWMKKTFGTPTGSNHLTGAQGGVNGINFTALLQGKKGIYFMIPNSISGFGASGHADILYPNTTCDGGCFFDGQEGGVKEIFIFELP